MLLFDWAALAHLSIGASIIGWIAWFYALARGGVARVAVLKFLQPVLSLVFAASLLGEPITPLVTLVAGMILLGVTLARRYTQEPAWRRRSKSWAFVDARLRLWSIRSQDGSYLVQLGADEFERQSQDAALTPAQLRSAMSIPTRRHRRVGMLQTAPASPPAERGTGPAENAPRPAAAD